MPFDTRTFNKSYLIDDFFILYKNRILIFLKKEVIQGHLPVALPCYDFTAISNPKVVTILLSVKFAASLLVSFRSVTGGVYKDRERIHRHMADWRLLAIPASCRRVAAYNPN